MTILLPEQPDDSHLICREVAPAPVPPEQQPRQRRGFFRFLASLLGIGRDYAVPDLLRLKEAEIRDREAKADKTQAEADLAKAKALMKLAEAQEKFDRVERERHQRQAAEQMISSISGKSTSETSRKPLSSADPKQLLVDQGLEAAREEITRVRDAISTIVQCGGHVVFDREQLLEVLRQGLTEFPNDDVLKLLAEEIEELLASTAEDD